MRPNLLASLLVTGLATLTGCVASPTVNFWIEARNDCVRSARALQLKLRYSAARPAVASRTGAPAGVQSQAPAPALSFSVNGKTQTAALDPASSRVILSLDGATPEGGLPPGATVQVTGTAPAHLRGLSILEATFHEAPPGELAGAPACAPSALPSTLAYKDPARGWVLRVRHESAVEDPLTLHAFQWTIAEKPIALSHLAWGDALLEALPWVELLEGDKALEQGAEIVFDVPDEALAKHPVWLVRAEASGPTAAARGVVQVVPGADGAPVRAVTWGEIKANYR